MKKNLGVILMSTVLVLQTMPVLANESSIFGCLGSIGGTNFDSAEGDSTNLGQGMGFSNNFGDVFEKQVTVEYDEDSLNEEEKSLIEEENINRFEASVEELKDKLEQLKEEYAIEIESLKVNELDELKTSIEELKVMDFEEEEKIEEGISSTEEKTEITVQASAVVKAVPDKASVIFRINNTEKTPDKALKDCSARAEDIQTYLEDVIDVPHESITTESTDVNPQYSYEDATGESKLDYYLATITLSITDLDIEEVGKIISEGINYGVDEVNDLRFYCSDYDEKYNEALGKAMKLARSKADVLAEADEREIVGTISVTEGYQDLTFRYTTSNVSYLRDSTEEAKGLDWQVPISVGSSDIEADVTVSYLASPMEHEEEFEKEIDIEDRSDFDDMKLDDETLIREGRDLLS